MYETVERSNTRNSCDINRPPLPRSGCCRGLRQEVSFGNDWRIPSRCCNSRTCILPGGHEAAKPYRSRTYCDCVRVALVFRDYNRAQETVVTIYLLEIMGLGLILFLVAMVWQESEISPGTSTNVRRYHITL